MEQGIEGSVSDTAAKIDTAVSDLAAQTEAGVQGKLDQSKGPLYDPRASAGEAMDNATDLARKASTVGGQAVARAGDAIDQASDAIQGAAREVGNTAGQAVTRLYQQGGRAGAYVSRFTADQPLTALLIAGALGYGLAYLIRRS
jgi:phage-related minor tail protein